MVYVGSNTIIKFGIAIGQLFPTGQSRRAILIYFVCLSYLHTHIIYIYYNIYIYLFIYFFI